MLGARGVCFFTGTTAAGTAGAAATLVAVDGEFAAGFGVGEGEGMRPVESELEPEPEPCRPLDPFESKLIGRDRAGDGMFERCLR